MLKKIYKSILGTLISIFLNTISIFHNTFMVYGFFNFKKLAFMKFSRISSSAVILSRLKLDLDNHVWIGHFNLLDASNGLKIEEGVQTGTHVSIFSHSSHDSLRFYGNQYFFNNDRITNLSGPVVIGKYSFIGSGTIIFPGVNIGHGSVIKAGSVVMDSFPENSYIAGNPAKLIKNILKEDLETLNNNPDLKQTYYNKNIL